jgi:hypothetical protein
MREDGLGPALLLGDDLITHGSRAPVELVVGVGEETAASEHVTAKVGEPGVHQRGQPNQGRLDVRNRGPHLSLKDRTRCLDGLDLQLLLGPKVGKQTALRDAELGRQPADRQPF